MSEAINGFFLTVPNASDPYKEDYVFGIPRIGANAPKITWEGAIWKDISATTPVYKIFVNNAWDTISSESSDATPTGTITLFAGVTAPDGWLFCSGQSVSSAIYSNLYATITGNNASDNNYPNFNVPNIPQFFVGTSGYIIKS